MKPLILLLLCLVATACVPALAVADNEPNDGIGQWEGPYAGDTGINGTFAVANDVDWYGFYARGAQVSIPVTNLGQEGSCRPLASLRDGDGHVIASVSPDHGQTATLILDASPGVNRYFVSLQADCPGGAYTFTLTPGDAIATGPKRNTSPQAAPEPNDSLDDAFGPLEGGTDFAGLLDSSGDQDWYFVYTESGPQPIDVALTNTSTDTSCAPTLDLFPGDGGTSLGGAHVDKDTVGHVLYTSAGAQKLAIRVRSQCDRGSYALRVDPPGALSQDEPDGVLSGPSTACKNARNSVKRYLKLVRKTNREIKRAKSRRGKQRATARRRAFGRQLENARDRVVRNC